MYDDVFPDGGTKHAWGVPRPTLVTDFTDRPTRPSRPNRARTVLVYIQAPQASHDSSPGGHDSWGGGRTIFPLCGPELQPQSPQGRLLTTFRDALQSQWGDDAASG